MSNALHRKKQTKKPGAVPSRIPVNQNNEFHMLMRNSDKIKEALVEAQNKGYQEAFDDFLMVSISYLYLEEGYRKKRLLNFCKFVLDVMACAEGKDNYFKGLKEDILDCTGLDFFNGIDIKEEEIGKHGKK